jgi:hypothetical protein
MRNSSETDELRSQIEESDAFTRCDDCGTHVVSLGPHRCRSPTGTLENDRSARRERAKRDDRNGEDRVGIFRRTVGNTYAYHELEGDDVYCGRDKNTKATKIEVVTRSEAKSLGRSPCGNCQRLHSLRSDDE